MESGVEPFRSALLPSTDAKTQKTRMNVMRISTPHPWPGVSSFQTVVRPNVSLLFGGVRPTQTQTQTLAVITIENQTYDDTQT